MNARKMFVKVPDSLSVESVHQKCWRLAGESRCLRRINLNASQPLELLTRKTREGKPFIRSDWLRLKTWWRFEIGWTQHFIPSIWYKKYLYVHVCVWEREGEDEEGRLYQGEWMFFTASIKAYQLFPRKVDGTIFIFCLHCQRNLCF